MIRLFINLILFIAIILGGIAAGVYLKQDVILQRGTEEVVKVVSAQATAAGVEIREKSWGEIKFQSWNEVGWFDVHLVLGLERGGVPYSLTLDAKRITLSLVQPAAWIWKLHGDHVKVVRLSESTKPSTSGLHLKKAIFKANYFNIELPANPLQLESSKHELRKLGRNLQGLMEDGQTIVPIEFEGNALFGINFKPAVIRLQMAKQGKAYHLTMAKEDLRKISQVMDEDLTEYEVELLAQNALKAPLLLQIRSQAETEAKNILAKDAGFPWDAYKHVLWSYLLTKSYGPEFAERVTDAHELGDTDNTVEDHIMDYNNNKVGRSYARSGQPRGNLVNLVKTDKAVILARELVTPEARKEFGAKSLR